MTTYRFLGLAVRATVSVQQAWGVIGISTCCQQHKQQDLDGMGLGHASSVL